MAAAIGTPGPLAAAVGPAYRGGVIERLAALVGLWSLFVLGLVLFAPWRLPVVPCARLVGTPESRAACEPILAAANQQVWLFETLPLLVAIAAGYVVIAALEVRRARRSRGRTAR